MVIGALVVLPAGLSQAGGRLIDPVLLVGVAGVALLSSVIPYSLEMIALRRLAAAAFGVLMSLEPAVAALAGRWSWDSTWCRVSSSPSAA